MISFADCYRGLTGHDAPAATADFRVTPWVMNSREVVAQGGFVARPGASDSSVDGHRYIGDALQRGAAAVIAERDRTDLAMVGDGVQIVDLNAGPVAALKAPTLFLADDSLAAIQRLAAWWRQRANPGLQVVAITGSVGKTTTKELIAAVLSQRFRTWKSRGNYNSDIGMPMSLLDMPLEIERAVVEMGMTRRGEIAELVRIAHPQIGVVTNVGPAHMMQLGSFEAITAAKQELVEGLPASGLAILNADDWRVRSMADKSAATVVTYGSDPSNDVWADEVTTRGLDGISLRFHRGKDSAYAHLPLLGQHSVHGSLAAATVGLTQGMSWGEIIAGLKSIAEHEVLRIMVVEGLHGSTLIDDTYNASPDSVMAALNLLADLDGRKIAVLGDMKELGPYSHEGHALVSRRAGTVADRFVAVGEMAPRMIQDAHRAGMAPTATYAAQDAADAEAWLRGQLQQGDIVLVKASRAVGLDQLVTALTVTPEDI